MYDLYLHKQLVDDIWSTVETEFWDFDVAGSKMHKQIMARFHYCNLFTLFHFSASFICLFLLIMFPLVEMPQGVRPLPNIIWTPFDTNPSPLHEILYVIMLWNLSLSILGNAFYDSIYVYAIQHILIQYKLLKELLANVTSGIMTGSSDVKKFSSDYFQDTVMNRIKVCAEHHSTLLK